MSDATIRRVALCCARLSLVLCLGLGSALVLYWAMRGLAWALN